MMQGRQDDSSFSLGVFYASRDFNDEEFLIRLKKAYPLISLLQIFNNAAKQNDFWVIEQLLHYARVKTESGSDFFVDNLIATYISKLEDNSEANFQKKILWQIIDNILSRLTLTETIFKFIKKVDDAYAEKTKDLNYFSQWIIDQYKLPLNEAKCELIEQLNQDAKLLSLMGLIRLEKIGKSLPKHFGEFQKQCEFLIEQITQRAPHKQKKQILKIIFSEIKAIILAQSRQQHLQLWSFYLDLYKHHFSSQRDLAALYAELKEFFPPEFMGDFRNQHKGNDVAYYKGLSVVYQQMFMLAKKFETDGANIVRYKFMRYEYWFRVVEYGIGFIDAAAVNDVYELIMTTPDECRLFWQARIKQLLKGFLENCVIEEDGIDHSKFEKLRMLFNKLSNGKYKQPTLDENLFGSLLGHESCKKAVLERLMQPGWFKPSHYGTAVLWSVLSAKTLEEAKGGLKAILGKISEEHRSYQYIEQLVYFIIVLIDEELLPIPAQANITQVIEAELAKYISNFETILLNEGKIKLEFFKLSQLQKRFQQTKATFQEYYQKINPDLTRIIMQDRQIMLDQKMWLDKDEVVEGKNLSHEMRENSQEMRSKVVIEEPSDVMEEVIPEESSIQAMKEPISSEHLEKLEKLLEEISKEKEQEEIDEFLKLEEEARQAAEAEIDPQKEWENLSEKYPTSSILEPYYEIDRALRQAEDYYCLVICAKLLGKEEKTVDTYLSALTTACNICLCIFELNPQEITTENIYYFLKSLPDDWKEQIYWREAVGEILKKIFEDKSTCQASSFLPAPDERKPVLEGPPNSTRSRAASESGWPKAHPSVNFSPSSFMPSTKQLPTAVVSVSNRAPPTRMQRSFSNP